MTDHITIELSGFSLDGLKIRFWQFKHSYRNSSAMYICKSKSSLWTSLLLGEFTNKLQAHSEERVLEWIRLNREENIDGPITGESAEACWDGGRPKLRSISGRGKGKGGGGETKHRHTRRGE